MSLQDTLLIIVRTSCGTKPPIRGFAAGSFHILIYDILFTGLYLPAGMGRCGLVTLGLTLSQKRDTGGVAEVAEGEVILLLPVPFKSLQV